jgi:hypothetical protein
LHDTGTKNVVELGEKVPIIRQSFESSTVAYFKESLDPYFKIQEEVWGTHIRGILKRIDAILIPKPELLKLSFPEIPIGVEIKTEKLEDGNKKQIIETYHQAISYRHTRFKLNGSRHFLPLILIYPPMSNYLGQQSREFSEGFQYFATRLSGLFFIGEIFLPQDLPDVKFMFKVCGAEYFKLRRNGTFHRWNSNWGFEAYEKEKQRLIEAQLSPAEYEREILSLTEMLGI